MYLHYDFNQSWDSPSNIALLPKIPAFYRCPNAPGDLGMCNYFMVGPKRNPARPADARRRDRLELRLVESLERVAWLKPDDLDSGTLSDRVNDASAPSISSNDPSGPIVLWTDGTIDRIATDSAFTIVKERIPVSPDAVRGN